MKRILCSPLVAALPFGSVLADAPKSKNAKVVEEAMSRVIDWRGDLPPLRPSASS